MAGTSKPEAVDSVEASGESPRQQVKSTPKRIKAIPFSGSTTIIIRSTDFDKVGVTHAEVLWDYRIDNFSVAVGDGISSEAAEALVKNFPDSFVFV